MAHSPRPRTGSSERFRLHKGGGHSIETRGVAVRLDPVDGALTSTPTLRRRTAPSKSWWRRSASAEQQIRVVAPDTGGGFGPKATFYPEELALPAAALLLRRPLKWIEDRRENFVATGGERDQVLGHGDGGRCRGPHARAARPALPRPRRQHALRRSARLQRRHQRDRPLRAAGLSARHQLVPDQLRALRADARRRPPAGHVCDGADARRRRGKARDRARRGAAAQHDPAVADALCDADQAARRLDHDLRQRRLSGVPAPRARRGRLGGFPGAAGSGAERRALPRARPRQLRRGHRARPVRKRGASRRRVRQGRHHHRSERAGPGRQDHADAACRRRARREARGHRRGRGRHRRHGAGLRRVRQPPDGDRRQCGASGRRRGARQGDQGRRGNARSIGRRFGIEGRRGAGQRRAADAEDLGADRPRHRRRAGLCAAERRDAGTRRLDRLSGAGADLLQRHACLRGRGRSRDRTGAAHPLHRGARLRPHHQSDDRRRPGARRGRPRHRRNALRMDALRRAGPAADRDLRRLSACRAPTPCRRSR